MALRPIDNALPIEPERPKKQVKASNPIQKQSQIGVNDENKPPLPPSADATIDYISSENLKPVPDPESKIQVPLSLYMARVFLHSNRGKQKGIRLIFFQRICFNF